MRSALILLVRTSLVVVTLVAGGCQRNWTATCDTQGGTVAAEPLVQAAAPFACAWNARDDKPAFMIWTDQISIAVQVDGGGVNGTWTLAPWIGAGPSFDTGNVGAVDQPLQNGQAALYAHFRAAGTGDAKSVGGGVVSLSGVLPSAIGSSGPVTVGITQAQLSSIANANPVANGTAKLYVRLTPVQ